MAFVKFQVRSSGQWLNIYGLNAPSGTMACQGQWPYTDNFSWEIINSAVPGWSLIQSKDTRQYLNIQNGGNVNGTIACQDPLPNPVPDNFLWQIEAPDTNGWSMIKVKSSGKYLNVLNNGMGNGNPVGQSDTSTAPYFKWMQCPAKDPKNVIVTMDILNCASIYTQLPNGGPISEALANACLQMEDDKGGAKENPNQNSFETTLNPGSQVTWQPKASGNENSGYTVAITKIIYEQGSGNNVLGPVTPVGNSGNVQAQVSWTAIRPDSGDNEAYTIEFTLKRGNDPARTYTFDPKIRVDPNT